ncbi:MAG: hypothetical protein JW863_14865 [Chitinispirillaceae bacterium]|nr:hypothetical protein [Chitinispirillaceae bacterium]
MRQFVITPAAGKRIIARAVVKHPAVTGALEKGLVVVIAGTTGGYIAEELLTQSGQADGFSRQRFFRGVTLRPGMKTTASGRLVDESAFPGDVVLKNGVWQKGKMIFDIIDELDEGDVIIKGVNCIRLPERQAGILIGHPSGGTIAASLGAVIGRRVKLILAAGLEKRVYEDINHIAELLNMPGASGPRMLPVPGELITEIDALKILFGVDVTLVAGGGIGGAEGCVWLAVQGDELQLENVKRLMDETGDEEPFSL